MSRALQLLALGAALAFVASRVDAASLATVFQDWPASTTDAADTAANDPQALDTPPDTGQAMQPGTSPPLDALVPAAARPADGYDNPDIEAANVAAFGVAVATAEGTINGPNEGYDVLFGWPAAGRTFDSENAKDHPRQKFPFTDKTGKASLSSAAGRYQVIAPTYDSIIKRHGLEPGFTPEHQEDIMEALLKDAGALADVKAGRFDLAVSKARRTWASLPGAGYNQQERSLLYVRTAYVSAGGALA